MSSLLEPATFAVPPYKDPAAAGAQRPMDPGGDAGD